jgi:hypothetical protein
MMNFCVKRLILLAGIFALASTSVVAAASNPRRFHYMGTPIFNMPTGYVRSSMCYINDAGHSAAFFSQGLLNQLLELSYLRHLNDSEKGKNITSFKMKILEEDTLIPSIVWGMADLNEQLGDRITYFAGSKAIEAFGVHLHAGTYEDPLTSDRKYFYAVEKMIFPLVTIGAERNDDIDTFGIKLSPYPGLSIEVAQRDRREELYNFNYYRSF